MNSKFIKRLSGLIAVTSTAGALVGTYLFLSNDEKFFRNVLMPGARLLDAETSHELAVRACKLKLIPWVDYRDPESMVR